MTGACEWSESSEVISGMLAPPPMVTTAATFVQLILLRSNAFSSAVNTPSSVGAIRLSSSVRVTRIPEWYPGSSAISSVTVSVDSRSLALRHSSRSLVSDPTAAVPAGSYATGVGDDVEDVVQQRLVDQIAGELRVSGGVFDRLERRCGISQRDARPAATEVQQRHHAVRAQPGIGVQRGQRGDGVGYQPGRHSVGRKAWVGPHRGAQRPQRRCSPVRRDGDRGLRRRSAGGVDHRLQGIDQ